jgi:hypothetical protein
MSTVRVNNIKAGPNTEVIPTIELTQRVVKTFRQTYAGGSWLPTTAYQWLPAGFVDYVPARSDTRIRFSINISYAHNEGHGISHCIFFANGVEQGRHSISGQSPEHRHLYVWDVASWGITSGRIGYQVRAYGTSNRGRFHSTFYWNGAASNQAAQSEIVLEEYTPVSVF